MIDFYQVHEGNAGVHHIIAAHDPAQARGIAFAVRFSDDPEDWGSVEWRVDRLDDAAVARLHIIDEETNDKLLGPDVLAEARAANRVEYVASSMP